jgi:N-acetylglucosamine-6-phosphate deacetylase
MIPDSGYFDLQVNGYAGVDFQRPDLDGGDLHRACQKLRDDGVAGILVTIITEDITQMCLSMKRIADLRERDSLVKDVIAGFHIEGPFINETDGYRGAHPRDAVRPASPDAGARLIEAAGGLARIMTLAPERDPGLKLTRMVVSKGVVVSAGHCNPTPDELKAAVDAGVSMFTHLGNGCPQNQHRHNNIVQRALSLHARLWLCFIADGVHVPFFALGNYLRCAGLDRCIVVTDAIAPAGLGPGKYTLGRWNLVVNADMVALAPDGSHLIGSACTMRQAELNLTAQMKLSAADAHRLLCENPRKAIGVK